MNLDVELDRITAPPACASRLRKLSRDEIEGLQAAGKITPLSAIPVFHLMRRESFPPEPQGGSLYGKSIPACKRFHL